MCLFLLYPKISYTLYWVAAISTVTILLVSAHIFIVVRQLTRYSYDHHLRHSDLGEVRNMAIATYKGSTHT